MSNVVNLGCRRAYHEYCWYSQHRDTQSAAVMPNRSQNIIECLHLYAGQYYFHKNKCLEAESRLQSSDQISNGHFKSRYSGNAATQWLHDILCRSLTSQRQLLESLLRLSKMLRGAPG